MNPCLILVLAVMMFCDCSWPGSAASWGAGLSSVQRLLPAKSLSVERLSPAENHDKRRRLEMLRSTEPLDLLQRSH
ncbi:MAG: hypothetical protein NZO58_12465 [Gemmataceae bacterium]|nr:hypothetical protein [Gemmataceae bacterium]